MSVLKDKDATIWFDKKNKEIIRYYFNLKGFVGTANNPRESINKFLTENKKHFNFLNGQFIFLNRK